MNLTLGVAAHVDAGKTTLCEQLLRRAGVIRACGRVDHGDAFMDDDPMERARGITIFTEQATLSWPVSGGEPLFVTLMDTPGHVDFSGEMERALSVLDAALLVVSCAEGVQSHTVTLFKLLQKRKIPTILFLNKTDREGADVARVTAQMRRLLSGDCVLMAGDVREALAERDELLLEQHLEETASRADYLSGARRAFAACALYPVLAGSALGDIGVDALAETVGALCRTDYARREGEPFSAKAYRVRRVGGVRYTYVKVTSGVLRARDEVRTRSGVCKVAAILAPQGGRLLPMGEAHAGQTAALAGLSARPGERIGDGFGLEAPETVPLMSVQVEPTAPLTQSALLAHLREMEEEDPLLSVRPEADGVSVGVMGAVQVEVLQGIWAARFGDAVRMCPPHVLYKETIAAPVVGVGHYEPLRHYAEVHLILAPLPQGSGLVFDTVCSEDVLDRNWQRLILTHLQEKQHLGVLTGSPVTDLRITLAAGRAHLKHTEGGDFRQATYRAVRQGLMKAESILLEPYYAFRLTVPPEQIGRAISDIRAKSGSFDPPVETPGGTLLQGRAPVSELRDYARDVAAYTRGRGRLSCEVAGYFPCHNTEAVVAALAYDPAADLENTPDSVFCSHGAGITIPWDQVEENMHLESVLRPKPAAAPAAAPRVRTQNLDLDEKELQRIIEREFGPQKTPLYRPPAAKAEAAVTLPPRRKEYLIVDGYNMIFAWDGLREQAGYDLSGARERLLDLLSNYCGFHPCELIVVFDSYRVRKQGI